MYTKQRTKKTIYGFVRRYTIVKVSIDILNIIFYYYYINFKWSTKNNECGEGLIFSDDDRTVTLPKNINNCVNSSTCIFNTYIASDICKQCNIYFKYNKQNSKDQMQFIFGYVESRDDVKDYNYSIFRALEKNPNQGFGIACSQWYPNFTMINAADNQIIELQYKVNGHFKDGDEFKLSFNFNEDNRYLQIYHNDSTADKISLHDIQTVIPVISMRDACTIKFLKYELIQ